MKDPATVVCRIGKITIWHIDPMKDGTDDSCGWGKAKLTDKEKVLIKKDLDYLSSSLVNTFKEWYKGNELRVVYTLYHNAKFKLYKKRLKPKDYFYILDLCLNPWDDLTIYYDSFPQEDEIKRMYYNIARLVKTNYRPWWKHPKYHFWHWSIK